MTPYRIPVHRPIRTHTVYKETKWSRGFMVGATTFIGMLSGHLIFALLTDRFSLFYALFSAVGIVVGIIGRYKSLEKVLVEEK